MKDSTVEQPRKPSRRSRVLKSLGLVAFWLGLTGTLGMTLVVTAAFLYLSPKLPDAETYRDVRLENPLRIFTADGRLIAEFGDKKRDPVRYEDLPPELVNALLASEDRRFYNHNGVDLRGLARSVVGIITGNDASGGGSTLTMQVAKQISFAGEDPYSRKFKEILLAIQIERELEKDEIIELYMNLSFFGISAYGISAAAHQYYDKNVQELTLAEMATMVGILPSPNRYNPAYSPELALERRSRVLSLMLDQGRISRDAWQVAQNSPLTASRYGRVTEVNAPYVAELVRLDMVERFGDDAMRDGYEVYTTIDSRMQATANLALKNGLERYDHNHGYRGPEAQIDPETSREEKLELLRNTPFVGSQAPALVETIGEQNFTVLLEDERSVEVDWEGMRWAKRFLSVNAHTGSPRTADEVVDVGDLVRVYQETDGTWALGQIPEANGGLVALDPGNGGIRALVGGYDYYDGNAGKFNRVTQALRQPGSNFKPFLYTAALANGYTAASLINDAPLARSDYRPENFNRQFMGYIRLKYALTQSKNLVSLRLYDALGPDVALPYIARFGFETEAFPRNDLTVAIGSQAVTPLTIATGYAVFANGGYKVEPYLIDRIENFNDGVVYQSNFPVVCDPCAPAPGEPGLGDDSSDKGEVIQGGMASPASGTVQPLRESGPATVVNPDQVSALENEDGAQPVIPASRVIDERVAYIMNTILRSVITDGSGRPANRAIDRDDLHGKTGTSNEAADLWFSGYGGDLVTTVYVGFDTPSSLGRDEQAATVSLPIWIDFMKEVLQGRPEVSMAQPDGLVTVRINPETGKRARPGEPDAIFEVFREEDVPSFDESYSPSPGRGDDTPDTDPRNIFN